MATVLRGGKWGALRSRSAFHSTTASRNVVHRENPERATSEDDRTILSLVEERKRLGIASYDIALNEIHVSSISCADDYADAARVISSTEKCHVLIPASYKNNDMLLLALQPTLLSNNSERKNARETQPSSDGPETNDSQSSAETQRDPVIVHLPNHEFGLNRATQICSLVTVLGMPANLEPDAKVAYFSHVFADDPCIIRAVGGLLSYILQNGILGILTEDDDSVYINAIRHKNHGDVMRISSTTLRALHVFSQDTHPVGRGSLRGKEGLSLYGIIKSYVKTTNARKLLRSWMHYPSTNLNKIRERQLLVSSMKGSSNRAFLMNIKDALRGVQNVPGVLSRLKRICADVNDWKALYSSTKSFIALAETLRAAVQQNQELLNSALVMRATSVSESKLREALSWMDAIVDFDESVLQGRMVVASGFSQEIDDRKHAYAALDDFLTKIGVSELKSLLDGPHDLTLDSLTVTYEPQIGYLVALGESEIESIEHDVLERCGLSFVFRSDEHSFFKNETCRQLDTEPGDIHGTICDLEAKAIRYLETKIFACSSALHEIAGYATKLDCLQAFSSAADEFRWVCPTISNSDEDLEVEEGRHALLELTMPSFVPNATKMKLGDVHVLTGPNYSGKSVYLTQVALIAILAQVGSCVPAKKARVSLIGCINTRVTSYESVAFGQSSFFADAAQVSSMLDRPPGRCMNLIDEFGKGTSEIDGMALLASTLRMLLKMQGEQRSFTLCATHFIEILKKPFLPLENPNLSLFSMEVLTRNIAQTGNPVRDSLRLGLGSRGLEGLVSTVEEQGERIATDQAPVIRTYRLLPGSVCNESRALQCALEAGVPKNILQRAAHIHAAISNGRKIENVVAAAYNNPRIKTCIRTVKTLMSASEKESPPK